MIEIILAVVLTSCVVSGVVFFLAKRKYKAMVQAEENERLAKLEVARMRQERLRRRQEFVSRQFTAPPQQVVTSVTPSANTRTVTTDNGPDILTAMILQQTMNSPTGQVSGTVNWDSGVPIITPTVDNDDESRSSRSSYSSSYSSSDSDSSYSSSSSDSSYSSSND